MLNERMLLNNLLGMFFSSFFRSLSSHYFHAVIIYKADPDVLVGHEFLGVYLDVLLNRMRDLKADHWSRISRFRRAKWPSIGRQGTNLRFLNGRLLCDLASDGAKVCLSTYTSLRHAE
jgi:DNA polymerase alpha subunit A